METSYKIYKVYYGTALVYIGRTKQDLQSRLRCHFFKKPKYKVIDIHKVSKVEYAEVSTMADMYLYEIYYINKLKPLLNKDDKATDNLTITLPELEFTEYTIRLKDKWIKDVDSLLHDERLLYVSKRLYNKKKREAKEQYRKIEEYNEWLNKNKFQLISEEEFQKYCITNKLPF